MGLSVSARLLETTALIAVASPVVAQTWDGQSGTDWTFGTNWNPDGVPGAAAAATIDGTGATDPTIAAGDAVTVDTVLVSGGTLTIGGSLTATTWVDISGTGTVRVNDGTAPDGVITLNVNVQGGGTLSLAGAVTGDLDVNGGALDLDGGSITGLLRLSGGGVVTAISDTTLGRADIGVNSNKMGTFTTADGVTLTITAPLRRLAGSDTIFGTAGVDGTVVVASNIVTVANDSAVTVAGGTLALGSGLSANSYLGLFTGTSVTVDSGAAVDMRGLNTTIGNLRARAAFWC